MIRFWRGLYQGWKASQEVERFYEYARSIGCIVHDDRGCVQANEEQAKQINEWLKQKGAKHGSV